MKSINILYKQDKTKNFNIDILNQEPKKRLDRDLSHLQKFDLESEQSSARCQINNYPMLKIEPRFAFFAFKKVPP